MMFASEITLAVHPADDVTFLLIASPSGSYFPRGVKPVTVWLSADFSRAAPGGTGAAKTGGNYAGGLLAQAQAAEHGCDQVVWLDSRDHRWVEEMGGMNLCFVYGSGKQARLMTPALTGTLLPGVTRDSLLTLGRDLGYTTEEGKISVDEWRAGCEDGSLTEVFACGTAAVITPVGAVRSAHGSWTIGGGGAGEVSMRLRQALVDIQRGAAPDPHGWLYRARVSPGSATARPAATDS
jgi:branched-chain amino acid aminotransferase